MILGDRDLLYYIRRKLIVIEPFDPSIVRENGIDLRLGRQIARMKNPGKPFDVLNPPKDYSEYYVIEEGDSFIIHPYEHVLLTTLEYIKLPEDIMAFVNLRSTYARLGIYIPPCLHPDTLIIDPYRGVVRAREAGNVIEASPSNGVIGAGSLKFNTVYEGLMVEVKTSTSKIMTTPNHGFVRFDPILLMTDTPAIELNTKDFVAITRRLPLATMREYLEPPLNLKVRINDNLGSLIESKLKELELGKHSILSNELAFKDVVEIMKLLGLDIERYANDILLYFPEGNECIKLTEILKPINVDTAYIIGVILAKGTIKELALTIDIKDKAVADKVVKILEREFPRIKSYSILRIDNVFRLIIKGLLFELIKYNIKDGNVLRKLALCSEDIIASFIAGMFDASGNNTPQGIVLEVNSADIAYTIQLLLLRLGLVSKVKEDALRGKALIVIDDLSCLENFIEKLRKYSIKRMNISCLRMFIDFIPLDDMTNQVIQKLSSMNKLVKDLIHRHLGYVVVRYNDVEHVINELIKYQPPGFKQAIDNLIRLSNWFWDPVEYVKTFHYRGEIIDWQTDTHYYIAGIYLTHNTIVDAGFEGNLTIELIGSGFPVKLYAGERFVHLVFAKLTSPVEKPYKGKYQRQRGVTLPKFP